MGGQVHVIDNVPFAQTVPLGMTPGLKTLVAKTGGWLPFTMRVDQAPFSDVRVRQAMRLIVDRPQMIAQALSGQGSVANDLFSPFDPSFNHSLPQRHQDLDQAKSLLKAAGHADLAVELVTGDVAAGLVEAAQVFAQQAQYRVATTSTLGLLGENLRGLDKPGGDVAGYEFDREVGMTGRLEQRFGLVEILMALRQAVVEGGVEGREQIIRDRALADSAWAIICGRSTMRRMAWRTRTSLKGA